MLMTILMEEYEVKVNCFPIKIVEEVMTQNKLFIILPTSSREPSPGDPDAISDHCKLLRNSVSFTSLRDKMLNQIRCSTIIIFLENSPLNCTRILKISEG